MSATATPSLSLSNFRPRFQNPAKSLKPTIYILSLGLFQEERSCLLRLFVVTRKNPNFRDSLQLQRKYLKRSFLLILLLKQLCQVLLFVAFLALTVLTIGVVYIGVTLFLVKREREKFEKAEAAKRSKRGGKKKAMRAKAGPRGFGQKFQDYDIDIDLE